MINSRFSISIVLLLFATFLIALAGCEYQEAKTRISEEMGRVEIKFDEVKAAGARKWALVDYKKTKNKRAVLRGMVKEKKYIKAKPVLERFYILADQAIERAAVAKDLAAEQELVVEREVAKQRSRAVAAAKAKVVEPEAKVVESEAKVVEHEVKEASPDHGPYVVKKGDWLYKIARDVYGDQSQWRKIRNGLRIRINSRLA